MEKIIQKAKFKDILMYGMGGVGSNIAFMLVMSYLMFFYTDFFGINAAAVGGLFLVSRFVDAITDPTMGVIADRSNGRFGKYRGWIMLGAPVLGISVALLFSAPAFSPAAKLVYVYVTYIFYSLISTVVNIPYHSLTPVLTEDPDQRTTIATTKQVLGQFGTVFVTVGAIPITTMLGGNAGAWQIYGILSGIMITLAFFVCAWGAKKYDRPISAGENVQIEKFNLNKQLSLIYKNKPRLKLMSAFGTDMVGFASANAVNADYFIYAVQRPDLLPVVGMFGLAVGLPVSLLIPMLSKIFGKKRLFMTGSIVLMFLSTSLIFIPFDNINLILIQAVLVAGFAPFTGVVGWAILADCVDYGEWVTGERGAGTISSQLTFINKLGMAIGGLLVGVLLANIGYVANQAQAAETLRGIVYIKALFPAVGYLCSIISMSFYPITKEFYYKMLEDNEKRRAEAKSH
ncbi:MAG: MFS transporter [Lachnospiraceae bacterium]